MSKYDLPESITYFEEEKKVADESFKQKNFKQAVEKYKKILEDIKTFCGNKLSKEEDLHKIIHHIGIPVNFNIAKCLIKENSYKEALEYINKILELENNNIKARYLRFICNVNIEEIDKAETDYDYLLRNCFSIDKEIVDKYNIQKGNIDKKRGRFFKKMISSEIVENLYKEQEFEENSLFSYRGYIEYAKFFSEAIKKCLIYPISYLMNGFS